MGFNELSLMDSPNGDCNDEPCGELQSCREPECTDCGIPFVSEGYTATRYPRRAILTIPNNSVFDDNGTGVPECEICSDCAQSVGSFVLNLKEGKNSPSISDPIEYDLRAENPAAGPFIFLGDSTGNDLECSVDLVDPDTCSYTAADSDGEGGYICVDQDINIFANLIIFTDGASWYCQAITLGFLSDVVEIADSYSLETECGTGNALVVPDTIDLPGNAGNAIGGLFGQVCEGATTAQVVFTDWVERSFPT